jgi:ribosomal subunit interface protein
MDILIYTDGFSVSEDLRLTVHEKIGRAWQYVPRAMRARVSLRRRSAHPSATQYSVSVLEIPGNYLSAEERGPDPVTALDRVADTIERRLRRRKTDRLARRTAKLSSRLPR